MVRLHPRAQQFALKDTYDKPVNYLRLFASVLDNPNSLSLANFVEESSSEKTGKTSPIHLQENGCDA